jgi:PAS domain S-box-containing protein
MFRTTDVVKMEIRDNESVTQILKEIFELNILTSEYLSQHVERVEQQWLQKFASLGESLYKLRAEERHPEHFSNVETISSHHKSLGDIFLLLQANSIELTRMIEENRTQAEIDLSIASEELLAAQMLVRSQGMVADVFELSTISQQKIAQAQQNANSIVLLSIFGFSVMSFSISFLTARAITRPLNDLVSSAKIIGGGNLNHRAGEDIRNEFGALAIAFNEMTASLKQSYQTMEQEVLQRKLTQEQLRKSEEQFRSIFESTTDSIIVWDKNYNYLFANQAAIDHGGISRDEVVGKSIREGLGHIPNVMKLWMGRVDQVFSTGETIRVEDENAIGEKIVYSEAILSPLRDSEGKIFAVGVVTRDITGRKEEEQLIATAERLEQLVQERTGELAESRSAALNMMEDAEDSRKRAEKAEKEIRTLNVELEQRVFNRTAELEAAIKELEAFSYSVSHDLRAPLRSMDGFARVLSEDFSPELPEEGQRYLRKVRNSAQKMGILIDDLLAFSHLSRSDIRVQKVAPKPIVHQAIKELEAELVDREVEFTIGELSECLSDPGMLRQVFVNLLQNAIKFTRGREPALIEVGCQSENHREGVCLYYVKDNGVGFDMRYVDKLFGVFQRLHRSEDYEGTGVGLATVERIIHRHGGEIWAESQVDKGTTIYFTLPAKEVEKLG